jgi:hypothetical protein
MAGTKPRLIFVTYAAGSFEANLERNAAYVRRYMKADEVILLRRADLEADPIYAANRAVFDAPRGAGYWAWKPWAIGRALARARDGDVVVYQDAGFGLRYHNYLRVEALAAMARERGYIAGVVDPTHGPNRKWNRRSCLTATGELIPAYLDHPSVEAVLSLWTTAPASVGFVREWQRFCLDPDVIGDAPDPAKEDPDFVEHRYDQAILTNLAIRNGAPVLRPPEAVLPFAKSLMLLELVERARSSRAASLALNGFTAFLRLRDHIKGRQR